MLPKLVHMGLYIRRLHLKVLIQESDHAQGWCSTRILGFERILHRQQLNPIACRKDQRLANSRLMRQRASRIREPVRGDRQPLPHLDRRSRVVHTQKQQLRAGLRSRSPVRLLIAHGALNLCTAEREFAAHTANTTRNTNPER